MCKPLFCLVFISRAPEPIWHRFHLNAAICCWRDSGWRALSIVQVKLKHNLCFMSIWLYNLCLFYTFQYELRCFKLKRRKCWHQIHHQIIAPLVTHSLFWKTLKLLLALIKLVISEGNRPYFRCCFYFWCYIFSTCKVVFFFSFQHFEASFIVQMNNNHNTTMTFWKPLLQLHIHQLIVYKKTLKLK